MKPSIFKSLIALTIVLGLPACSLTGGDEETQNQLLMMETQVANQQAVIEGLSSQTQSMQMQNQQMAMEINSLRERISHFQSLEEKVMQLEEMASRRVNLGPGNYAVHLASYRGIETATAGWHNYVERYADQFSGLEGLLEQYESPNGQIFFRLKAASFSSESSAQQFCNDMESLNEYCMVDDTNGDLIE